MLNPHLLEILKYLEMKYIMSGIGFQILGAWVAGWGGGRNKRSRELIVLGVDDGSMAEALFYNEVLKPKRR